MMTLMILVSATWTGLYLAKRITRPVQLLAAGAREIGAGHLDHRIEPETRDEFGSLVEAFNTMAGELAASQRKLERSRVDLERKNPQLDERRRYIETVLERIATGVVSLGADGRIETINGAALRLLEVDRGVVGSPAERRASRARTCGRSRRCCASAIAAVAASRPAQEIALAREGRELHLAAAATPLQGEDGSARRRGARVRRRDAAHPDAARRGVARRRAAAGARDQEPADADSALRRADAPAFQRRAAGRRARSSTSARRRSSARSSRSRRWSTSSRSSRGCRRRARCRRT